MKEYFGVYCKEDIGLERMKIFENLKEAHSEAQRMSDEGSNATVFYYDINNHEFIELLTIYADLTARRGERVRI